MRPHRAHPAGEFVFAAAAHPRLGLRHGAARGPARRPRVRRTGRGSFSVHDRESPKRECRAVRRRVRRRGRANVPHGSPLRRRADDVRGAGIPARRPGRGGGARDSPDPPGGRRVAAVRLLVRAGRPASTTERSSQDGGNADRLLRARPGLGSTCRDAAFTSSSTWIAASTARRRNRAKTMPCGTSSPPTSSNFFRRPVSRWSASEPCRITRKNRANQRGTFWFALAPPYDSPGPRLAVMMGA